MATHILHIVPASYFNAQSEDQAYLPEAYPADGFIHCTREPEVMLQIANRFYQGVAGNVLVLVIDADRVSAPVRWEPPAHPDGSPAAPGERLFPHIYGPLNRDAIISIRTTCRAEDGSFLAV